MAILNEVEIRHNPNMMKEMVNVSIGLEKEYDIQQIHAVLAKEIHAALLKELQDDVVEAIKAEMPEIIKRVERELVVKGLKQLVKEDTK